MTTPTIGPEDEVLSLPQAAHELRVARNTVHLWTLLGRIPSRILGGRVMIRRKDLEAFKASHPPRQKRAARAVRASR